MVLTGYQTCGNEARLEVATNQPVMRTVIRSQPVPDVTNAKPIQRAFFSIGTNQFAFVIPENFKLDASQPNKIILTVANYTCFITVQLIQPTTVDAPEWTVDSFRNQAQAEFPEADIIREFELRAANRSGPAYELRGRNSEDGNQMACVGFVPSNAGWLKFSFLSDLGKYPENQISFRCLLRSFQSNARGKLEILPVSGAS